MGQGAPGPLHRQGKVRGGAGPIFDSGVKGGIVNQKTECCLTCYYYQEKKEKEGPDAKPEPHAGECWANPPQAQMLLLPNPLSMKPEVVKYTFFPVPDPKIACGRWRAKKTTH
jgi:hypothetical protein